MATLHTLRISDGTARPDVVEAFQKILNFSNPVCASWGVDTNRIFLVTTSETQTAYDGRPYESENDALLFSCSGYEYTGNVLFMYYRGGDTFRIYKVHELNIKDNVCKCELIHDDVFIGEARNLLDEMIETGGNAEEYEKKVNDQKQNDPLYSAVNSFMDDDDRKEIHVSTPDGGVKITKNGNGYTVEND